MSTTTNVANLKINVLTKAQFNGASKNENEIYLVTDDSFESEIKSALLNNSWTDAEKQAILQSLGIYSTEGATF